jgi:hypothetical protein
MPPPALMKSAIRLAPIPTPAIMSGSGNTKYNIVITIRAIAGTESPTVAPPRNAVANAGPNPFDVAWAALTAALTVILREMRPVMPDSAAPTAKAMPFENPEVNAIIIASATAAGITILNSRLKKA